MDHLPGIFALLVAAAGWYYLFYSTAAQKLETIEGQARNRTRVRLRRINGFVIIVLAAAFYAATVALARERLETFGTLMFIVAVLMGAILVLGLIDLRLTSRLRGRRRDSND